MGVGDWPRAPQLPWQSGGCRLGLPGLGQPDHWAVWPGLALEGGPASCGLSCDAVWGLLCQSGSLGTAVQVLVQSWPKAGGSREGWDGAETNSIFKTD